MRHCSLSHQSPTCSHTRTVKRTQRTHKYTHPHTLTHNHTLVQSKCETLFLFQEALTLPFTSLVFLLFFLLYPFTLFYKSGPRPPAGFPLKHKREGGGDGRTSGEARGRGQRGAMCQNGRKITLHHVVRPIHRPRHRVNTPIKGQQYKFLTKRTNNATIPLYH